RLIVVDQGDDVPPRDVVVVHDREAGRVEVQPDLSDRPTGDRRPDRAPVQHAGQHDVVRVAGATGGLADAVFSGDTLADCGHGWKRVSDARRRKAVRRYGDKAEGHTRLSPVCPSQSLPPSPYRPTALL